MTITSHLADRSNSPPLISTEGRVSLIPPLANQINRLIEQRGTKQNIIFPPSIGYSSNLRSMHLECKSSSSSSTMTLTSSFPVMRSFLTPSEQVKRLQAERIPLTDNLLETDLLSDLLRVGAKGSLDPRAKDLKYGGADDLNHLNNRANYAESLLQEVEARKREARESIQGICKDTDIDGLRRIYANRLLQLHHAQIIRDYTMKGQAYTRVVNALVRLKNEIMKQNDYIEIQVSIKEAIDPILDRLRQEAKQPSNSKIEVQAVIQTAIDHANLQMRSQQEIQSDDVREENRTSVQKEISRIIFLLQGKGKQQLAEAKMKRQAHIQELIANIHLLDDTTSYKIITLSDGVTLFPLPGGAIDHFVCYEFRKYKERDEYEFVIHDRSGNSAVANWMKGTLWIGADEKIYKKTSLAIKTSKAALTNPKFIESLLSYESYVPYVEIYLFLIELGRGEIVQSEIESLIDRLAVYREIGNSLDNFFTSIREYPITYKKLGNLMALLVRRDKYFHSTQRLLTCTESNSTEIEKQMAAGSVRKALKLHAIKTIKANFSKRLDQIKEKKDSDVVCTIGGSDYNTRITKIQYQQDVAFVHQLVAQKEAHLAAKLSGETPHLKNLKETIKIVKDILDRLDACIHPEFLVLKEEAQKKFNARKPKLQKYLVEHNQDMKYYLSLVPDAFKCNADFMLRVIVQHPEHTNPWSNNLQKWFTAWGNALHPNLKNSEDFILKAVAINPMALQAASDTLRDNETFITRICEINATSETLKHITPWALIHASPRIISMSQYIDKLPAFPANEETRACLENLIPEDISESEIFRRKFNTPVSTSCSIQ